MANQGSRHHGGNMGSKPAQSPAISSAELAQLRSQVARLTKIVEEHLAEKNQWNSEVRGWVNSTIQVKLVDGETVTGTLLWVDRYTMAIQTVTTEIIHKAAIVRLRQS